MAKHSNKCFISTILGTFSYQYLEGEKENVTLKFCSPQNFDDYYFLYKISAFDINDLKANN